MIATIIRVILGGLWKPLAALLGALGVYWKGRSDAKAKAKAQAAEKTIKTMKTANEVEDEVAAKSDDAVRDALGKWVRRD